jgi:hypothetical protein
MPSFVNVQPLGEQDLQAEEIQLPVHPLGEPDLPAEELPVPNTLFAGGDIDDGGEDDAADSPDATGELFLEDDENEEIEKNDAYTDIGLSLDDAAANEQAHAPRIESWIDIPVRQNNVRATIGEPTDVVWSEAVTEMNFVREHVFQKKFQTNKPSIGQLSDLLFGPTSKIFGVFEDHLNWTKEQFQSFLRTFLVLCAYKLSVTSVYSSLSYIDTRSILEKAVYVTHWKDVGLCSLSKNHLARSHIAGQTFWAAVENALNTDLRTKILPSLLSNEGTERFRTIFDDDKMHFNLGRGRTSASLKMSRHIRDNRIGPVCHEAVLSASGILVGCSFEKSGDTTKSCTTRILKEQMVPMQGGDSSSLRHLNRLSLGGDRAYQNKDMLFETILPSGAQVLGTKQRTKDHPFTYGQKMDPTKDKREDVPMNGAKTLLIKKVRQCDTIK